MSRTITAMALAVAFLGGVPARAKPDGMPWVAVSRDRKGFVLEPYLDALRVEELHPGARGLQTRFEADWKKSNRSGGFHPADHGRKLGALAAARVCVLLRGWPWGA